MCAPQSVPGAMAVNADSWDGYRAVSRGYVVLGVTRDRLQADWWLLDSVTVRSPEHHFAKGLVCEAGSRHLVDAGTPMASLTVADPDPAVPD